MPYLQVDRLEHSFGALRVLDKVSFSAAEGERICLLGPSGCGKTTTLQVIAGFLNADAGTIHVQGEAIDPLPPEKRNIGIMFQNYALFPHMTIFENVAFGLRMRRLPAAEIQERVADALRLVRLSHKAQRSPKELSGGEQQRIAFARAIAIRPRLLLLDEPFSNLDARLRIEMRTELLQLLRPLRIATVMVTHDQEEAMAIADRVAVMRAGRIEQIGTTKEVYCEPTNLFVARFVGESNVLDAVARRSDTEGIALDVSGIGDILARPNAAVRLNADVHLILRPETLTISEAGKPASAEASINRVTGTLDDVMFLGHRTEWRARVGSQILTAWQSGPMAPVERGSPVSVEWKQADAFVVPKDSAHVVH